MKVYSTSRLTNTEGGRERSKDEKTPSLLYMSSQVMLFFCIPKTSNDNKNLHL